MSSGSSRFRAWWWLPLGIFALTRLLDAVLLTVEARRQVAMAPGGGIFMAVPLPASPSYWQLLTNYDGQWYEQIALHGYPHALPAGTDSLVGKNPWAFFPLYPAIVRGVMTVTSLPFGVAASLVSLVCAGAAMLLLFRLVSESGGRFVAAVTVLALCVYPSAVLFQAAYTEGLALLLVLICLVLLRRRRYAVLALVAVALSLTRPIVPVLAVVVAVHGIARWRGERRGGEPFPVRERVACAAAAVVAALSFLIWPVVAGVVTGEPRAYLETQNAWAHGDAGWPSWLAHLLGRPPVLLGVLGLAILAAICLIVGRRRARVWGSQLRWWAPVYELYLLGTTRPTTSAVRYLMLAIVPWWQPPAVVPPTRRRAITTVVIVSVVGLVLQWVWVHWFFVMSQPRPPFGP